MIASTSLFPKFINFGIGNFDLSDHLPLFCTLKLEKKLVTVPDEILNQTQDYETCGWEKFKWNLELKDVF